MGTAPITGASRSVRTPSSVPAISATKAAGTKRCSRRGHSTPMASVTTAMTRALTLRFASASGSARSAPTAPPEAVGAPRNGSVWISMTMMPMPVMKPETTTWGV